MQQTSHFENILLDALFEFAGEGGDQLVNGVFQLHLELGQLLSRLLVKIEAKREIPLIHTFY